MIQPQLLAARKLLALAVKLLQASDPVSPAKKPQFVGVFFNETERSKLYAAVPAIHPTVPKESHITLIHASQSKSIFSDPVLLAAIKPHLGTVVKVFVTSMVADDKGQAVVCEVDPVIKALNPAKAFHITLSTADGIGAKYSNELLANATADNTTPIKDLVLVGVLDTEPRGLL